MANFELGLLTGFAFGGVVAGGLWSAAGRLGFGLVAALYLIVAAGFWLGVDEPKALERHPVRPSGLWQAIADPRLLRIAPAWLALSAVVALWISQAPFVLTGPHVRGQALPGAFDGKQVGLVLFAYAVVIAIGVSAWGFLLARVSRKLALLISSAAMLPASAVLYAINHGAGGRTILIALVIFVLLESGFTPAGLAYLADIADQGPNRGASMAVYSALLGLGSALGAGLGGWLAVHWSFDGLVFGTVGLGSLAVGSVLLSKPDRQSASASP